MTVLVPDAFWLLASSRRLLRPVRLARVLVARAVANGGSIVRFVQFTHKYAVSAAAVPSTSNRIRTNETWFKGLVVATPDAAAPLSPPDQIVQVSMGAKGNWLALGRPTASNSVPAVLALVGTPVLKAISPLRQ